MIIWWIAGMSAARAGRIMLAGPPHGGRGG